MLLKDSIVPGTRLRAKCDVNTFELLRVLGPQLGSLYEELKAIDPSALTAEQRGAVTALDRWFEVIPDGEKFYRPGLIREL